MAHPMDNYTDKLTVAAKAGCKFCGGEGWVVDWVPMPFGPGNCQMPSMCGCVEEQIPEDLPDEVMIVVVPTLVCVDPVEDAIRLVEDLTHPSPDAIDRVRKAAMEDWPEDWSEHLAGLA
jgi:hypothetical protein